ncbi:MAG: alpha-L-arabinofuranosidase [Lachnospiraceae bacterium]|nr:alpha-L-arabinofuranosidase [Lachnospiraceae bacterium]
MEKLVISKKIEHGINRDMIGLFFEDINFAADGGLYAELLENRSFEAMRSSGSEHNFVIKEDFLYAWSSLNGKNENLEVSSNEPVSQVNPHYLRFTADNENEGFANKAYDGITLRKGAKYKLSFYAKEVSFLEGDVIAKITKDGKTYAEVTVDIIKAAKAEPDHETRMLGRCPAKKWIKYCAELVATDDVTGAVFEMHLTKSGILEFDLISLIPQDAVAGIFKKSLFDALYGLKPGFLRFPGGCIVEGTSLFRRYRWKDTVGELKDRKINTNLWGLPGGNVLRGNETPDSHYMQSYGIGFYEYFLLCELLTSDKRECKPLPVLNIGVACQFRSFDTVPVDSPEFEEYVQDALDLIEFANGDTDTKWGALRAAMGHPASFNLEMIAIGNEQWESDHVDLFERYRRFEEAIHKVHPEIKCLGTAGPFVNHELHKGAWDFYYDEAKKKPNSTYAVDEHYYVKPQWLYDNVDFYDEYPRDVAVFAGEYAGHDANQSNSMEAALAEAAMISGMERNGDVVKLASYAPLFNRIGHSQWTPDLIWFDDKKVVLTPSYYVQKIFSEYAGTATLELNGQEKTLREKELYISLVKDGDKTILKAVNASNEDKTLCLVDERGNKLSARVEKVTLMSAAGTPKKIVKTEAVNKEGDAAIPVGTMTNREICEMRAPEDCVYTMEFANMEGEIDVPAGSFAVFSW